jgi:hypothetical protein
MFNIDYIRVTLKFIIFGYIKIKRYELSGNIKVH